ncbi:MAG: Polyprenyl synthetase, partial [Bacteroidota bacterium]|nr:Polyprenyl synthetase [Bacteroidota bacterium]
MELSLDEIKKPIAKELDEFEVRFRKSMKSNAPLLDRITHYIVTRKGKQMRPMFVFLSAKLCGEVTEATY